MTQFSALLYKNLKIITRQWASSLLQLLAPLFCIFCVLVLQYVGRIQANKIDIKPPFEIPFGGLYPVNLPLDLVPNAREWGVNSCLKTNKYAFGPNVTTAGMSYIEDTVGFKKLTGIRNHICYGHGHKMTISPSFTRTDNNTADKISDEILDQMEHYYGINILYICDSFIPSDGFYLFHEVTSERIKATLFSNNFNVQLYHRANAQTMIAFKNNPVSL